MLVSAVQQSESATQPLSFRFPSHLGHHRVLSRVPCAMLQVPIDSLLSTLVVVVVQSLSHFVTP